MYGFPPIDKIRELEGQELLEIACTSNQVILKFGLIGKIICEREFYLTNAMGEEQKVEIPIQNTMLLNLIDDKIAKIQIVDACTMLLVFSSGCKLSFFDDKYYESYTIVISGKEYQV